MINILTKEFDFEIANLYHKKKLNCNHKWSINFYIKKQVYIKHRPVVCHTRYLRNRKHVPCFYRVIQTRVGEREMLWEHEPQASVSTGFSSSPKLSRVFV